jgi:hypothetical protein
VLESGSRGDAAFLGDTTCSRWLFLDLFNFLPLLLGFSVFSVDSGASTVDVAAVTALPAN